MHVQILFLLLKFVFVLDKHYSCEESALEFFETLFLQHTMHEYDKVLKALINHN